MSNKRAKMDASIVMDEVDGLAAKELFGKGERRSALSTRDWTAARVVMSARGHRRLPVRRRPWVPRSPASHACFPLFAGVCYTYDDIIFHPGHINFAADAVSAHPPPLRDPPLTLLPSHLSPLFPSHSSLPAPPPPVFFASSPLVTMALHPTNPPSVNTSSPLSIST